MGERTFTARCADGTHPFTARRQAISYISFAHAQAEALRLAEAAAWAGLSCAGDPPPEIITYTSTQSATITVSCPGGSTGADSTAWASGTASSIISQEDADAKALAIATSGATSIATAGLVCTGVTVYTSTQTATVSCTGGTTGADSTATATRTSVISQDDADQVATTAAQTEAAAGLTCLPITYTSTQTATVNCPEGSTGNAQTADGTATSTISQDDADSKAMANAIANATALLSCTVVTYSGNAQATVTCCDGSSQTAYGASTGQDSQAAADAAAYQDAQSNAYAQCPSCD